MFLAVGFSPCCCCCGGCFCCFFFPPFLASSLFHSKKRKKDETGGMKGEKKKGFSFFLPLSTAHFNYCDCINVFCLTKGWMDVASLPVSPTVKKLGRHCQPHFI
eukprot:TRINITY_DN5825_c5_g1_i1.p1 TRINITY_DN5825_c5_g1~~TRINITY_DN5825_c5_g1_i1.p1  ORF type:complete len:104 (+),score=1.16 TRINITY_DN5825_c5_g1_i1:566-877(+)